MKTYHWILLAVAALAVWFFVFKPKAEEVPAKTAKRPLAQKLENTTIGKASDLVARVAGLTVEPAATQGAVSVSVTNTGIPVMQLSVV